MVNTEHVSASLRLTAADDGFIRTVSGVRPALSGSQVGSFFTGFNALTSVGAAKATHLARLEMREGN